MDAGRFDRNGIRPVGTPAVAVG
ncbi:hypothetical protein IBTHAUMO2_1110013 [Nitrosopumilaceae archaeon]|nr:hypothetical protein IBTHAUMO2_1110013 [Nitrosopumilaceae archaeon]